VAAITTKEFPVSALAHLVRRYPVSAFMVLACLFGWSPYILAAVGIGTNPSNMPLGPVIAALIVTSVQGRDALFAWGRRLRRWTASPWLYVVAFASPILINVVIVLVNHGFGAPLPTSSQLGTWPEIFVNLLVMLVMVGLGEEAGWTAFAAPVVMRRHGLLGAWGVLAPMRIFWHLPLLLSGEMSWTIWLLGNAGFQLIVLQLMRKSGGAWSLAAVWHATLNATGGAFFFTMVTGEDNDRLGTLLAVTYALVALGTVIATWGRRGERTELPAASEERHSIGAAKAAVGGRR
jgi:CAAX protease family protein